jgi:type II secretory pathway pseudopilin PulG
MPHKFCSAILITVAIALIGCGKSKPATEADKTADNVAAGIQSKLAAITAAGEPVTPAELDKWYVEPPASENAAEIYAQAFAALTADDPKSATYVAKNQKAVALLLQAAERKACRYPVNFSEGFATKLPHLANIKNCAILLQGEAVAQANRGHAKEAAEALLAGVSLAHSLDNEPTLISRLVEFACLNITIQGLEQTFARGIFAEEQLLSLQQAFGETESATAIRRPLVGERSMVIAAFHGSPEGMTKNLEQSGAGQTGARMDDYWKSPALQQDFDFALDYFANFLANADKPFPQSLDTGDGPKIETAKEKKFILSSMLLPALSQVSVKAAEAAARIRIAQAALAVERYRLQHANALPGALSELSPTFLEAVPTDPFDGQPLRYQKLPTRGYVIYSIGKDRKDDQGAAKAADGQGSAPDITFTVQR